ncbi:hypothetical protein [Paraburkholderia sp. BL21I4N1]|uniref:hypothetical protein n=1 Tax=Paraburkholderia sp. BL21I4N1 TaxID=1938801 RepID=UPI000D4777F6|nr:hypothetical protein [Paraburkholderia sp. BL21I4N1]PQV43997.1 hypothetical protein B0G83_12913 [Paraburkholderia sp. BL21I4N1]
MAAFDPLSLAEINDEVTAHELLALVDDVSDANGRAEYLSICAVGDEYEQLAALEVLADDD